MGLFGKDKSPYEKAKEKVDELSSKLRTESRHLSRQINAIEREEQKSVQQIKEAAKRNQKDVCKVLAKSLVHSRKQKSRIYQSQAEINSIVMQMKQQVAQVKMAGCIQKSTEVMKSMQNLVKIPELQKITQELSKEMFKAGFIEEMIEETMDNVFDDENTEDVADAEVEKILAEVTNDKLKLLPEPIAGSVNVNKPKVPAMAAAAVSDDDEGEEEDDMTKRLEALRS